MIRYPISEAELIALINGKKPNWLGRAQQRTQHYVDAGGYTDDSDFWGEIKQVYITLQHEKCAYCETKLQGAVLASKVHEVEHYRPKSEVKTWPNHNVEHWKKFKPAWTTGAGSKVGYYKLAYHHLNYAIACTRCNSTLKSSYFPIRGNRDTQNGDPADMQDESALLLYPVSMTDADDPQDIITFNGVLAVPKHNSGPAYERAVTNIEFFQLNHEDLTSRRAEEIRTCWLALQMSRNVPQDKQMYDDTIALMCSPESAFSSCVSAFFLLSQTDYPVAETMARFIIKALLTKQPLTP
ncbi:hypothetical protein LOY55_06415 [Pseudomonas sp. B21-040]|jgi:hypothetical protein|uniref:hypothetical protein n=1 Tax=Pseudomonas TaxID=286 RepID=UPI0005FC2BAD|nr:MULTISPECIES: hypothetical protein [Pseudomonas]KJZ38202.1 hypothetical protein VC33_11820 [Pseudomonas fluorescens]OOG11990.1 hypothetical protein BMS17_07755 [Pseudomonas sp. C9]PWK32156.1 hypothetical protein C7534_12160 [Pseudomonas sp. OV226]UVL41734.1 hypothetical protein LOY55_06415 [Pseudomonas sp. B21-040]